MSVIKIHIYEFPCIVKLNVELKAQNFIARFVSKIGFNHALLAALLENDVIANRIDDAREARSRLITLCCCYDYAQSPQFSVLLTLTSTPVARLRCYHHCYDRAALSLQGYYKLNHFKFSYCFVNFILLISFNFPHPVADISLAVFFEPNTFGLGVSGIIP